MAISTGFNHIGTLTTNMNRTVRFYEEAFDAKVLGEVPPREDHPWMKVVDIGGGAALNIFECGPGRSSVSVGARAIAAPSTTSLSQWTPVPPSKR